MNKELIEGWNYCIHILYASNIITAKDCVEIWETTTPQNKQDEYFGDNEK